MILSHHQNPAPEIRASRHPTMVRQRRILISHLAIRQHVAARNSILLIGRGLCRSRWVRELLNKTDTRNQRKPSIKTFVEMDNFK